MKITVVGVPGSGKTTVAKFISEKFLTEHYTEIFENNVFLNDDNAPNELKTLVQLENLKKQYRQKNNHYGISVFESIPEYQIEIFNNEEEQKNISNYLKIIGYPTMVFDVCLYLNVDLPVLQERVMKRNREGFTETELKTLKFWHNNWEKFLNNQKQKFKNNHKSGWIVNGNASIEDVSEIVFKILNKKIHR